MLRGLYIGIQKRGALFDLCILIGRRPSGTWVTDIDL
jgi:hypothetical protein